MPSCAGLWLRGGVLLAGPALGDNPEHAGLWPAAAAPGDADPTRPGWEGPPHAVAPQALVLGALSPRGRRVCKLLPREQAFCPDQLCATSLFPSATPPPPSPLCGAFICASCEDPHLRQKERCRGQEPRPAMDLYGKVAAAQEARGGRKDASDQNFDYMFKLLIIGNSSVGKTSFLFRYADDSFTSAFVSTVGIDFKVKTVFKHEKRIKLQIWDTAGQERYRTITTAYYRGAMGFILMYDITNEESFSAVQDWSTQIKTYSWDEAQVILVGNKCDMEEERVISTERGRRLGEQLAVSVQ
ncbi:ras-related protein Rab-3C isoform 2-T2 [Molossus nigricans]